jgi:hypothetical protein
LNEEYKQRIDTLRDNKDQLLFDRIIESPLCKNLVKEANELHQQLVRKDLEL